MVCDVHSGVRYACVEVRCHVGIFFMGNYVSYDLNFLIIAELEIFRLPISSEVNLDTLYF